MQQNPFDPNLSQAPPIPMPEALPPVPVQAGGDWSTAPIIVRGWAYPLAFLGMVVFGLAGIAGLFKEDPIAEKIGGLIVVGLFLAGLLWLRKGLRRGASAAWTVQIILSALGVLGFPLGTLIHGYILSQWFKPEVKAWFGQR